MQQQQGQSQLTVQQNLTPASQNHPTSAAPVFQNPYLNVPQHPVQPQSNSNAQ